MRRPARTPPTWHELVLTIHQFHREVRATRAALQFGSPAEALTRLEALDEEMERLTRRIDERPKGVHRR